ncbi:MAG: hypothetical protein IKW41_06335 [Phascolarctobacterium sp.]|nr:hypothetical protein [Phascolarctobacterium sp.]
MENVLQHLTQFAPGFVGVAAAKLMVGKLESENLNSGVLKYFLYTCAAWLFALLVDLLGMSLGFTITETTRTIISLVFAFILGLLWPVWLCEKALSFANGLRACFNKEAIFSDETILHKIVSDNRPHYYEIYKGTVLVASGWSEYNCFSENSMSLIKVDGYDVADMKEIRNVVWVASDTVIKEYAPLEPFEIDPETENKKPTWLC